MDTSDSACHDLAVADATEPAEVRLAELSRAAGPLRRVLAALAGRLVERRRFEPLGYARLGDYARERLGVSARTVQELARVESRLLELPRLEAALVSGRLPWSKVRLLARFVTTEDEGDFIARAEGVSVRMLERELRAVDRGQLRAGGSTAPDPGDDEESIEVLTLSAPMGLVFKWRRTCRYAEKVACEPTLPGGVLEWVTAEAISGLGGGLEEGVPDPGNREPETLIEREPESSGVEETEEAASVCAPHAAAANGPTEESPPPAPEFPRFLRAVLEGIDKADAHELDARLRQAVRLEQRLEAEVAPLLREVTAAEYEWRDRYQTLAAYARERLGMSPRKARALLRLERAGDLCPELRAAYRDGALSWVQAQAVARLVIGGEGENRHLTAWVKWAQGVTVRRLEETVREALLALEADPTGLRSVEDPEQVTPEQVGPERQTCARPRHPEENIRLRVRAPREVARLARDGGAARSRAARRGATCTCTTSASARPGAATSRRIRRRCAPSTTSGACTRRVCASAGRLPTGSGSSSAPARGGPRWCATARGTG